MRRVVGVVVMAGLVAVLAVGPGQTRPEPASGHPRTYLVVYAKDVPISDARTAILQARGSIVLENRGEKLATVRSSDGDFVADVDASPAILGAAPDVPIGPGDRVVVRLPSVWHAGAW